MTVAPSPVMHRSLHPSQTALCRRHRCSLTRAKPSAALRLCTGTRRACSDTRSAARLHKVIYRSGCLFFGPGRSFVVFSNSDWDTNQSANSVVERDRFSTGIQTDASLQRDGGRANGSRHHRKFSKHPGSSAVYPAVPPRERVNFAGRGKDTRARNASPRASRS